MASTIFDSSIDTMTGATSSTPGLAGLVPAPAAGDEDKVLKGDGTWGTAGAPVGNVVDLIYPVGSIYMSVNSTSPSILFGAGTWERIKNKFLLGTDDEGDENETYSYPAGTTGGSSTHTLTIDELPSHNHTFTGSSVDTGNNSVDHTHSYTDYYATTTGGTAITTAQLASHTHRWRGYWRVPESPKNYTVLTWDDVYDGSSGNYTTATGSNNQHTHSGANVSEDRTSEGASVNHTHTVTAAGTIGSTGSGNAFSIMPPYIAVYMWKRTA